MFGEAVEEKVVDGVARFCLGLLGGQHVLEGTGFKRVL